jgi:hypothetical protein
MHFSESIQVFQCRISVCLCISAPQKSPLIGAVISSEICHLLLGTWSPTFRENVVLLSLILGTKKQATYADSKCQEPLLHHHIPEERLRSACTVWTAEDTQWSNRTTSISMSSYYCGIRLEALRKIRNCGENWYLIRVSNPEFFKTSHWYCHWISVRGIAMCSAATRCYWISVRGITICSAATRCYWISVRGITICSAATRCCVHE